MLQLIDEFGSVVAEEQYQHNMRKAAILHVFGNSPSFHRYSVCETVTDITVHDHRTGEIHAFTIKP